MRFDCITGHGYLGLTKRVRFGLEPFGFVLCGIVIAGHRELIFTIALYCLICAERRRMRNVDLDLSSVQLHGSSQDRHCFRNIANIANTKGTTLVRYLQDSWKNVKLHDLGRKESITDVELRVE